jgi:hypothetical protein
MEAPIHQEEAEVEVHQHLEEAEEVGVHRPRGAAEEEAAQSLPPLVVVVVVAAAAALQHLQVDFDVPVEEAGEGCLKQAAAAEVETEQRL